MRKWVFRALVLSLLLHAGLFVFFHFKRLQNFGLRSVETLTPPRFVVNKVTIDPKSLQDPDEIKTTLKDKPKPVQKIDVPVEKIPPTEISVKPQNPEITSPILADKPKMAAMNTELLAKVEATSAGALEKELGSIANSLIKESVRSPKQPVVFTLPKGGKEIDGGTGESEGIPGLRSLDEALGATGPLATGDRLGVRGGALFEYDKADLLQQAIDDLQKLGEIIKRNPRATFTIEGHTDAFGNPEVQYRVEPAARGRGQGVARAEHGHRRGTNPNRGFWKREADRGCRSQHRRAGAESPRRDCDQDEPREVSGVPDELVTFVQVLSEDDDLRAWFESFVDVSDAERAKAFLELAARMQAGGERQELIAATTLLAAPEVYRAARAALEGH